MLSTIGCAVLIGVNVAFVPTHSYVACAWAGCAGYGTAMVLSYFLGQHYYPIAYPLKAIGGYVVAAAALYAAMTMVEMPNVWLNIAYRTALLVVFVGIIYRVEHLSSAMAKLPVVGKYFKKA